jgi:glycine oxidase
VWLLAVLRGARILAATSVRRFSIAHGACRGVETDAGPIEARLVVDAAGAWAAFDFGPDLGVPVEPVRGQIVELRLPERPLETVLASDEVYVVPRPDGTVLLGSTVERVGFRKEVTAGAVEQLLAAAGRLFPETARARFTAAWAGLRPGTPDGWPLLGATPVEGLFLATGHFRNGILLAPATARHLAELLTGGPAPRLAPFSVERFAGQPSPA